MGYCSERRGNASVLNQSKREPDAPCIRPVCDVSHGMERKSLSWCKNGSYWGCQHFLYLCPYHHQMHEDKAVCAVQLYFNAIRSLGYRNLFKRVFLLFICLFCLFCLRDALRSRTLGTKRLSGAQLTQHAGTTEIVLSCWSDETLEYAELEIPEERKSFLFQEVKISGLNQAYELSSWQLF